MENRPDEAEFRAWLLARLGEYLERPVEDLDTAVPFAESGLDSVAALSLCGDIEDAYGLVLEPTVVWDHPTVAALSRHLCACAAVAARPAPGAH
ncbi:MULTISPECIES: acyl carrier protein [unclassified Streptomyces]|uniref:acyl carrier protein n=1 Tax=unclassified Streptomyces TaxID=2593676 RepID=UPI000C27E38A|nr:acyl carrier protein [Streptomyces sp. CB02959]PJN39940.1 polyketide synthase [Streptomyces sp. CB02959]